MKRKFYSMLLMFAIFAGTQLGSLSSAHAQDVWFASESYFDWYYHDDTIKYSTIDNDGYFCNASVGIIAVEKGTGRQGTSGTVYFTDKTGNGDWWYKSVTLHSEKEGYVSNVAAFQNLLNKIL